MFRLILASLGIIVGAPFQFGYANGVMNSMSGALETIFNENGVTVGNYGWNTALSLTTGLWCAGGGVGALMGGPMAQSLGFKVRKYCISNTVCLVFVLSLSLIIPYQRLGRKLSLIANNLFLMVGAFLQVTLPTTVYGACPMA